MKSLLSFLLFAGVLFSATSSTAQDNAAAAERAEMREDIRGLRARIEDLESRLLEYKRLVANLTTEIHTVRDDLTKANANREILAMKENVEGLRRQIEKVDENRVNDSKRLEATLKEIVEALKKRATTSDVPSTNSKPPPANSQTPPSPPSPGTDQPGFIYTVQDGDNLGGIVKRAKEQGITVTTAQVKEANPAIKNWSRIQVGQKIFIPQPPGK